jgi:hypothetical protein
VFEREKTVHALDLAATVIGCSRCIRDENITMDVAGNGYEDMNRNERVPNRIQWWCRVYTVINLPVLQKRRIFNQLMSNTCSGELSTPFDKCRLPSCMNHVGTLAMNPERVQNDSYIHFMGLYDVFTF